MSISKLQLSAIVSLVVAAAAAPAFGGGFEVPMQNARAAGQADAFIVQADDASAVWYNAAGLAQLQGTEAMVGGVGLFSNWDFHADQGASQSMNDFALLPHLYLSSDLGTERLRVGIGINNSFGLSEDWGDSGPLRFIVDDAQLAAINISPAVAYKLNERLSFGLALNVYYADLSLDRQVLLGAPPTPEGRFHINGNDWAVGYTPSVLWKINQRHAIGAFYRSPVKLNLEGEAEVELGGAPIAGPSRTNLPIALPQQIGIGYAVRPTKPLKIEANVIWTDWGSLDRLRIGSENPLFDDSRIPADWRSGFTYRLGAQYELTDNWTVRAGYAYGDNAVPEATFTPIVPDSDYHLMALGVGYGIERWSLDLAYQLIYRESRDIEHSALSPTIDGEWENAIHTVCLSAVYRF
ncbi:MAG TPA: TonB-dependent receptor [Tepidisphaeraceae bacterium]|nr:TonB-dependent receptor [Tepidisphaeraceae bacterium]